MERKRVRLEGIQTSVNPEDGVAQAIRISWQDSNGYFEWVLPSGDIELIPAAEYEARGGKIVKIDM